MVEGGESVLKITDAEAILRKAAIDVAGLPLEMASAVHSAAAGITHSDLITKHAGQQNPSLKASDEWALRRDMATGHDITDHPPLDEPIHQLLDAITKFRNALPRPERSA